MVRKMLKFQPVANSPGNEHRTQVGKEITKFIAKDNIRRVFAALFPKISLQPALVPVMAYNERIGGTKVTRFEYGGRP